MARGVAVDTYCDISHFSDLRSLLLSSGRLIFVEYEGIYFPKQNWLKSWVMSSSGAASPVKGLGPKWAERAKYWANPTPEPRAQYESAFAPETIKGQYLTGEKPGTVGPDGYSLDIAHTTEPGYAQRQDDLIFDYQTNVALYPQFQDYVRQYQPENLAAWGKNDPSFIYPGAPRS